MASVPSPGRWLFSVRLLRTIAGIIKERWNTVNPHQVVMGTGAGLAGPIR